MLRAFLDDLIAKPSRDTALILADWLDDHGDPLRAAAIRTGSRWRNAAFKAWLATVPWLRPLVTSTMYGLVSGVRMSWDAWLCRGPELVATCPIVRVDIHGAAGYRGEAYRWSRGVNPQPVTLKAVSLAARINVPEELIHDGHVPGTPYITLAPRDAVPPPIFARLVVNEFATGRDADRYLSRACIAWARDAASEEHLCA